MLSNYIFDIPIYRCTKEQYDAETEKKVESHIAECYEGQGFARPTEGTDLVLLNQRMGRYADSLGGPWYFNQVVGWLRLFLQGYNVAGNLWMADAKRLSRRMPNKTIYCMSPSNCLATGITHPSSSAEIYRQVLDALKQFATKGDMKRRYLDVSVLERLGPFVNWQQLLEDNVKR